MTARMKSTLMACTHCRGEIGARDFDWHRKLVRCSHCREEIPFERVAQDVLTEAQWRRQLKAPSWRFLLSVGEGRLSLFYWQGTSLSWATLAMAVCADLVLLCGILGGGGAILESIWGTLIAVANLPLIIDLLRWTEIKIKDGYLSVWQGIFPVVESHRLETALLQQFFSCLNGQFEPPDPGTETVKFLSAQRYQRIAPRIFYEVDAVAKDGRRRKMVGRVLEAEHARYIEAVLERYLGLKDRPIDGELPRGV